MQKLSPRSRIDPALQKLSDLQATLGRGAVALILAALAAVVIAAIAIASCGGSEEEANRLLNEGFTNSIGSANVAIDAELAYEGLQTPQEPIRLKLNGPYQSGPEGQDPSFDFDISLTRGGQPAAFGVVSTPEGTFISIAGTTYKTSDAAGAGQDQQGRSISQLGLKPREWVKDAETKGEEKIAGVESERVSATFDLRKFLGDLNEAVGRAGSQLGGQAIQLTPEQIDAVAASVKDPTFDAYVGKDDEKLHRLSTDLEFTIPERDRPRFGGAPGGRLSFSIEFADIGKRFTVQTPRGARPVSELREQVQGLGNLPGIGGGTASGGGAAPGTPPGAAPGAPPTTPGTDVIDQYSDCLAQADPADTDACADLLR
jgi:hypothetical protein